MPSYIRQLDDKVISQIAAGEVIESPSAVVKELIENSLDAGALSITVAVENGGKSLVRVTDDGLGMPPEDLKLCVHRHSTSKIRTAEDLQTVATLGFRGEALASIASVARIEIVTRQFEAMEGWRLTVEGAVEKELAPAGCAEGTSVTVRDLFFSIPARKKFLKSDSREADKCLSVFRALALSRTNVEWKYFADDKLKIHLPRSDMKSRIADLFGVQFTEGLQAVEASENTIRITGYISDKGHTRRTRDFQFLYLNGRRIIDKKLSFYVTSAYEGINPAGQFPVFFLFLDLDSHLVDVNVHPSKTEVRFQREFELLNFVKRSVRNALGIESVIRFTPDRSQYSRHFAAVPGRQIAITVDEYGALFEKPPDLPPHPPLNAASPRQNTVAEDYTIPQVLFQLHRKYIVTQIKSGLALIDQHAAHERILFEQALRTIASGKSASQGLLIPLQMEISLNEESAWEEMLPLLTRMGFEIEPFGPRVYLIRAVPAGMKFSDEVGLLREMLDYYRENEEKRQDYAERAAAAFACKAAIKTGDELSPEAMIALIEALFRTQTPYQCPHGRPTYIRLEMEELNRRFGRFE